MGSSNRIMYLDYIRITAMLLVVACHCFGDVSTTSPAVISLLTYLEMPCIGLFLAVSGALLLPVNGPAENFLKKRLNKVIVPTILWSILYMAMFDTVSIKNIFSMPFNPVGSGILWFMYTIVGLYLLSPIISPWIKTASSQQLRLYLLFWCIAQCYPILGNWIEINQSASGVLYYLSGYVGFFVLGFYLKKFGISLKLSFFFYLIALLLFIIAKLSAPDLTLYNGLPFLSIFGTISVIFYWNLIKWLSEKIQIADKWNRRVALISNLTFGVYFLHIGLIKIPTLYNIVPPPYILGYLIRIAIVFLVATIISYLISFLPFSGYMIGFHQNIKK